MSAPTVMTRCCVAGGGPAGMMLGFLLARAGVDVVVLEKHADFLRDFRGDTIHPSTLELLYELGLLKAFLALPHQKATELSGQIGDFVTPVADFSHLPTHCKFIAFMPQWDFLNFLAGQAKRFPCFALHMETEVTGLIEEGGIVRGVQARSPQGALEIRADLVVGADGRRSTVRVATGLPVEEVGAPMDVLWFHLARRDGDPQGTLGRFDQGHIFILINRGEHWQCGFVIPKGTIEELRAAGLDAFRASVARLVPFAKDRVGDIATWDDVKLLTVGVDRLTQWYRPGVLCIGDAAHTMSPVGGVGINLAVQDAVAAANILAGPLRAGTLTVADLSLVQKRRWFPMRVTQALQVAIQKRVIARVLQGAGTMKPPWIVRLVARVPYLQRIPARVIGLGIRPEHIKTAPVA